jgi:hypothetical protein
VATLTYVYGDRAVVVGPLATFAEPHSYDLCADHAMRLTPPRGWDLVRLSSDGPRADAVPLTGLSNPPGRVRGHLRVLPGHGDTDA